ncbi:MAG: hypothetical protein MJ252_12435 [archaeon]|nr:hypothetical protein [archaeon]
MQNANNAKGICCVIGAALCHLILGNVYTWGNIGPYYCSYIRKIEIEKKGEAVMTYEKFFFLAPIAQFLLNVLIVVSGYIEPIINVRFTIGIGLILIIGGYSICCFLTEFYLITIGFSLIGLGTSLCYFSVTQNCWRYFRKKKGTILGIINGCFGGTSLIFTSLGDLLINPKNYDADKDGYYDERVTSKVKRFLIIWLIILSSFAVFSFTLTFPYQKDNSDMEEEKETENEEEITSKNSDYYEEKECFHNILSNNVTRDIQETRSSIPSKAGKQEQNSAASDLLGERPLEKALKSKKFIYIFLIVCCLSCKNNKFNFVKFLLYLCLIFIDLLEY